MTTTVAPVLLDDDLTKEAEELDGYFSDTPLEPIVEYPTLNDSTFPEVLLVMNLPKVSKQKMERLTNVLCRTLTKIGTLQVYYKDPPDNTEILFPGYYMPYDEINELTYGFCFVCYTSFEAAKNAAEVLQNFPLDKNHLLSVTLYDRSKELQLINTETFVSPDEEMKQKATSDDDPSAAISTDLEDMIQNHLSSWLFDPAQRDQFIIRYGKETAVHWVDVSGDASANAAASGGGGTATTGGSGGNYCNVELDYDGKREKEKGIVWCDYYCYWSTSGNYLATLIPLKGVVLWGGKNYEKLGRFVAPNVKLISFSPQENYILTNSQDKRDPHAIKIYDLHAQKLLRAFPLYPDQMNKEESSTAAAGAAATTNDPPPPFLWSYDDAYVARMGKDLISIYELPDMKLLDQRSIPAEGICEFQWNPRANMIAYWAPEQNNHPAHVDVIEIPSRQKLRQKNLFNVTRCQMVWHELGHYLSVKVTRHTKSKKTFYNNIEFFRFYDHLQHTTNKPVEGGTSGGAANIPVEMLDVKDAVMALQFEPRYGTKLAMIHAENPSASKVKVSIYDMMKTTDDGKQIAELNLIETLDNKQCNFISWCPAGNVIVMASLGDNASGTIEFYDVVAKTLVVKEHYRCNQIMWDPSGRTVASIVSQPIEGGNFKFAMDNGYILWSYQGKLLHQQAYETFYQFAWRPRYDNLLSYQEIMKIRKNLKKYEKQFQKADMIRQRAIYLEQTAEKRYERKKYRELVQRNKTLRAKTRYDYVHVLYDGYDSDDEANYRTVERTIEAVLSRKEEVVT